MISDKSIKTDIEMDSKELQKKIRLEMLKLHLQKETLQKLKTKQKKIALKKLEAAINIFFEDACVLQLSNNEETVNIQFVGDEPINIQVDDNGLVMLYEVLKYGFVGVKNTRYEKDSNEKEEKK